MSDLNHNHRRNRRFRLEFLECRELLSTFAHPAHPAVDVSPLARGHSEIIKGTLTGTGTLAPVSISAGTARFRATGNLTILGAASLVSSDSYSVSRNHKIKYSNGAATLTDSSGDTIIASFKGSGKATSAGIDTFKVKGPVTGGSGLYAGAAGRVSASGSLSVGTRAFSITLTLTLKHT